MIPVYVPGCHVRLLHSASAADTESRRDSEILELVGLANMPLFPENVELVEEPKGGIYACGYWLFPGGVVKGLLADGTDRRRPGVRLPQFRERGIGPIGDCRADENLGLLVAVENVAEVGVLYPAGELPPNWNCPDCMFGWEKVSSLSLALATLSLAMANAAGRRRVSSC